MRKHFYLHEPTGVYYLCFGFMRWAAQALRVEKVKVGEEDSSCCLTVLTVQPFCAHSWQSVRTTSRCPTAS